MKKQDLQIQTVSIDLLKGSEYNPRFWPEKTITDLKKSIKKNGFVIPLLANSAKGRENVLISGHFRLKVAKDLGYKELPVTYVNIPNIKKEKSLNLAINRVSGEWDFELLKNFEIDMLLDVGFDDSDLSHIWDENLGVEDDDFDIEKEIKKIKTPKTKPGDLYQLGPHRLLCGDATNEESVAKLMGTERADMLYFDPPYNIGLSYDNGIGTQGKYGGLQTYDRKSALEYGSFLKVALVWGLSFAKRDCHVFSWCDENYIWMVQEIYGEVDLQLKRVCLWIKNNGNMTPQIAFNKVFEPCVYGTRGRPYLAPNVTNLNEILNKEIGTGNRLSDDILDLLNIWMVKRLAGQDYEHPTEKPPSLHEKALRRCTTPGDIVMDLYGGSGSTLIACEQLKRRAFLCEIEPIFCDLIIARYENLTGKEAKLCK